MSQTQDKVTCTKCGHETTFQAGFLTEDQKKEFVCQVCLNEKIVERQVQEREFQGKRILTEG